MKRYISQKPAWKRIVARVLSLGFYLVACACIGFGQKTCIPPVRGVPGFTNPQPNWWNPGAGSPDYQPSLTPLQPYDPRWVGAASYDYGSGTISDAEFLAESNVESGQTVLYLSWYVKGGPLAPISQKATTLYAGFMPSGGTTGTIIEITLNQFTGADSSGVEPMEQGYASTLLYFTPAIYQGSGTTSWTEATTLPNWLTAYTGVWALGFSPNNWAVEMRIPVDPSGVNGINIGPTASSPFSMWFALQPTATIIGAPAVIPYTMPRSPMSNPIQFAVQLSLTTGQNQYPDPATWAPFQIENPTSDPTTCLTGVYLADDQIGTTNSPSSYVSLSSQNTFFARPYNFSPSPVSPNVLSATFYLANWGNQIGDLTSNSWKNPPELLSVQDNNPGGIAAYSGTPPAPQGNITGIWTLTPSEKCAYTGQTGQTDPYTGMTVPGNPACPNVQPTTYLHNCMMVKLDGPGIQFSRASAFRNTDFVSASNFTAPAEVSVAGLGGPHGGSRDVYLFVEALNMPKVVTTDWKSRFNRLVGEPGKRTVDVAQKTVSTLPLSQIVQTVPIYIVRAYYDTGFKLRMSDGKQHTVLQPETSFGYFVIPHNDVAGWIHSLKGATPVGPNWYHLSVPNDGAAQIITSITPLDTEQIRCLHLFGFGVLPLLLGGMFVVGLMLYRPWKGKSQG